MRVCEKCIHFRRLKPASQLLARATGTTDSAISNALAKIQEDEDQQKGYETQYKMRKEISNDEIWGFRPIMSSYCGLQEEKEIYLIAEVKNSGGKCGDFKTELAEKHSCATCVHRILPQGTARDLQLEKSFLGMSLESTAVGMSTSRADNLLNRHQEGVASRKAFEARGVYSSKGILSNKPQYFAYCKKFSTEDEYVICLLQNPYNTCSGWEPAS